ncbi:hypothetical protein BJ996_006885 [Streptomyces phaeogriseichromatogenes]|nr:hypothetical protein [Streptomyces murinus]
MYVFGLSSASTRDASGSWARLGCPDPSSSTRARGTSS